MSDRHVYGGVFKARFEYVKKMHGEYGFQDLIETMIDNGYSGPKDSEGFKTAQKYPLEYLLIFLETFYDTHSEREFNRMNREVAKKKGVVGFLLRWAGNPELAVNKAGKYWTKFFDFGRLEGEMMEDKKARINGYDVSPTPLFCKELNLYFVGALESTGADGISIEHSSCVHEGDDHCCWDITWS
ncbi:MAG: hypothetical protein R6W73_04670 [Candidatus Saliniplasma sp.]